MKCDKCQEEIVDYNDSDNVVDLPSVSYNLCTDCVLDVIVFIDAEPDKPEYFISLEV